MSVVPPKLLTRPPPLAAVLLVRALVPTNSIELELATPPPLRPAELELISENVMFASTGPLNGIIIPPGGTPIATAPPFWFATFAVIVLPAIRSVPAVAATPPPLSVAVLFDTVVPMTSTNPELPMPPPNPPAVFRFTVELDTSSEPPDCPSTAIPPPSPTAVFRVTIVFRTTTGPTTRMPPPLVALFRVIEEF